MNIKFEFSPYSKSVITPTGEIFLFAGKKKLNDEFDNSVMEIDFEDYTF